MITSNPISSQSIFPLLFTILILGAICQSVSAQPYSYEVQTIPLKGDFINFYGLSFAQDRDGFIWFGSSEGLYRYQGTSVKVFRHIINDEHSLSNNYVNDLLVDSEGILWIGTSYGLNRFDKYTESFISYQPDPEDTTSMIPGYIHKIVEDRHKNIWIATSKGFCRFDRESEAFMNYPLAMLGKAAIDPLNQIFSLYPDQEDNLWLFAGDGVYRFHIPSGNTELMHDVTFQDGNSFTWDMFIDRSGRYWINTYRGLFMYDELQETVQQFMLRPKDQEKIGNQFNRSMLEDASGNLWIRTYDGIYCYSQELELKYYLEHAHPYPDDYRSQDLTKEMFVDNAGSIWYYSPDGINQLIKKPKNFSVYNIDTTTTSEVNCIHLENKNLIWLGTNQGIGSFDRGNNVFRKHFGSPWWESGLSYLVNTMYQDREKTLWIGMQSMGLVSMAGSEDGQRRFRRHIPESVDSTRLEQYGLNDIRNIFEDNRGRLWIGVASQDFLHYYDREENRMIRLVDNPSAKDKLPDQAMIRHQAGSDTLWAIGSSGVYKIMLPFTRISGDRVMPEEVIKCQLINHNGQNMDLHEWINDSYLDSTGTIWLATWQGLFKISEIYSVTSYTESEGLPSNYVTSILHDNKGDLWIGTGNGLSKFNIRTGTFTNYFIRHGLPSNDFHAGSSTIGENGEMFFGTMAGMISFYPDSIFTNQIIAPVMITGISINNQIPQPGQCDELMNSISFTEKLELPYNKNNLSVEYAILNYYHPELNQYKYKLEGLNDDWVYAGNRTNVDFTNLDPGKYTFRVVGSNNDGLWNEEGASLQIMIRPPPWKTWYAYVVYGLLIAGIILVYRRYLINRSRLRLAVEIEKVEKEKILEIDQMKSRFFANISHEFRTPLTLIRGPLVDLDKQETETISMKREVLGIMKRNTARLQNLINQLLDISRMETGTVKLQVSEGLLESFLRAVILSFLSLAESKKIKYRYQLPGSDLSLWYDADKMEMILVNLISNAFKFTPENGEISIIGEYINHDDTGDPEYISLIVSDTGTGIPSDRIGRIFDRFYQVYDSSGSKAEGTGIGLALTKELVDLYRGEINVESIEGEGTSFILKVPVARDLFREDERKFPTEESHEPVAGEQYFRSEIRPEIPGIKVDEKNKPLVLIVEDNPDLTQYIVGNLERQYRIVYAGNGKQGFEMAVENIPDLVISDLMMPVMDGMEMCGLIKEDERTSHIPLIMLTARADRDSKLKGLETGADDYMIKPFDAEELQVRVKNLIEQRMRLREKFRKDFAGTQPDIETPYDDLLMQKLLDIINNQLDNPELNIDHLINELGMSRTQVFRKINALTGYAPKELIRNMRLKKAACYFQSGHKRVAGVMHEVGFNNQSHFSKSFKEFYGITPSDYIKKV